MAGERVDVAVIGAGIVGLAAADAMQQKRPELSIVVLEKEPEVGCHQTGRNSGVIHAGLYYEPGSLKARLSVEGAKRLLQFCAANGIATTRSGKIVLATDPDQIPALNELERRARENGVIAERIGPAEIREREPHARGIDGLWVPATGAVDFAEVASVIAGRIKRGGASIVTAPRLTGHLQEPHRSFR